MGLLKSYLALFEEMSDEDGLLAMENKFEYIYSKAYVFLQMKPELYRKKDFFGEPSEEIDEEGLKLIKLGCQQILKGIGFKAENPFVDIGPFGFYDLMSLFHFDSQSRKTIYSHVHNGKKGALDCITFKHRVNEICVVYYNFCEYEQFDDKENKFK